MSTFNVDNDKFNFGDWNWGAILFTVSLIITILFTIFGDKDEKRDNCQPYYSGDELISDC